MTNRILFIKSIFTAYLLTVLNATTAVDFDAQVIHANTYIDESYMFSEIMPILSTMQRPKYTGPDIYGGFRSTGASRLYAAGGVEDAGLRIRWNKGVGYANEALSGLFLFKIPAFGSFEFEPGKDIISVQTGYMNPGAAGPNLAVKQAEIRLVLKDDSGYYISAAKMFGSNVNIYFNALSESYFSYNPSQLSVEAINIFGGPAKPSFKGIAFAGFYLKALRGSALQSGANIGVTQFTVHASKD